MKQFVYLSVFSLVCSFSFANQVKAECHTKTVKHCNAIEDHSRELSSVVSEASAKITAGDEKGAQESLKKTHAVVKKLSKEVAELEHHFKKHSKKKHK